MPRATQWIEQGVQRAIGRSLLALGLCALLSACNVIRVGVNQPITPADVTFIQPGTTTLAHVVAKLGSPDSILPSEAGTIVTYRFLDTKYSRVNFGWLLKPWSPVSPDLIISRTGLGLDQFEVLCNANGVVTNQSFLRHIDAPRFNPYPF
ncbi:MAG: hypothetical protein U0172_09985 [Nitrospiraceae bacterium]